MSKLIAIGCSYTEGVKLGKDSPWPALLAEKLNMDCINLGLCASGNDYMLAKIIDTVLTEQDIGLVVVMWSDWQRSDFLDDKEWIFFHPQRDNSDNERYPVDFKSRCSMLQYNNPYNATMKSLRHFFMAQTLLKDIPYFMIQGHLILRGKTGPKGGQRNLLGISAKHSEVSRVAASRMLDSNIFDEINEEKFIGWPIFQDIGGFHVNNILDKLDPERQTLRVSNEDTHPNGEGHKVITQEIYNEYKKIYS